MRSGPRREDYYVALVTTRTNGHTHVMVFDEDGGGWTDTGGKDGHCHAVAACSVAPAKDGHTHDLTCQRVGIPEWASGRYGKLTVPAFAMCRA